MPMFSSNKLWRKITQCWVGMGISSKLGLGGTLFLFLILTVAATGYIALGQVKKAEESILTSATIQRLILDMDRGMEKSRRLYNGFFLQYPIIGFEKAHQEYIQPSIRQIAQVITTSRGFKHLIEHSPVSSALQTPIHHLKKRKTPLSLTRQADRVFVIAKTYHQRGETEYVTGCITIQV